MSMDRRAVLTLAAAIPLVGAAPPEDPLELVKGLMERQRQAWNQGDLAGFCDLYADDTQFLSPSGVTQGRAQVLARYEKRYGTAKDTMGTLGFAFLQSNVSLDMVALGLRWSLVFKDKPEAKGLSLVVWQRRKEGWRLVSDASM